MHLDPILIVSAMILLALAFDFMNGFHDAANSVAILVSTRAMSPKWAVLWAAFFNFIAFLIFGIQVAKTIGAGIVAPGVVDNSIIFGALAGATVWNIVTWRLGIPSSSSHALVGGLAGAAISKAGWGSLIGYGFIKTSLAIVLSPLLGLILAAFFAIAFSWVFVRSAPSAVDLTFKRLQFVSASLYSLGHGGNDAQKTMGIIAALLFSNNILTGPFTVPLWVVLSCHTAMGLGTLFGGWRIVRTMGMGITKLKPVSGFCAQSAGAVTLFLATGLGIPVSTTHTITGAIVGVGLTRGASAVRWWVARNIVWAWMLTIPAAGIIAAMCQTLASRM